MFVLGFSGFIDILILGLFWDVITDNGDFSDGVFSGTYPSAPNK